MGDRYLIVENDKINVDAVQLEMDIAAMFGSLVKVERVTAMLPLRAQQYDIDFLGHSILVTPELPSVIPILDPDRWFRAFFMDKSAEKVIQIGELLVNTISKTITDTTLVAKTLRIATQMLTNFFRASKAISMYIEGGYKYLPAVVIMQY